MTSVAVRQSGGANIISIPKAIVKTLGLTVGSQLGLSLEGDSIVLTPIREGELSLKELLDGSPKKCFSVTEEDSEWLNMTPNGKEL